MFSAIVSDILQLRTRRQRTVKAKYLCPNNTRVRHKQVVLSGTPNDDGGLFNICRYKQFLSQIFLNSIRTAGSVPILRQHAVRLLNMLNVFGMLT